MLKTTCNQCIWNMSGTCKLDRPVFQEEFGQCTTGFCRYKRNGVWLKDNEGNDMKEIVNKIEAEESYLSAFVFDSTGNFDDFKKTIQSITDEVNVNQVVVSSCKLGLDNLYKYTNLLDDSKIKWTLQNVVDDELKSFERRLEDNVQNIKNHWFITVISGQDINKQEIEAFNDKLHDTNANFLCVLDNEYSNYIMNKSIFEDLDGNQEMPWIEKLQLIDENWKECCLIV